MQPQSLVVFNSSLPVSTTSAEGYLPNGTQGVLVMSARSGFDPALTPITVSLKMGANAGSGFVIAHSSKVITNNCMIGPLYFPAGQYVVTSPATGSTIVGLMVGIFATP